VGSGDGAEELRDRDQSTQPTTATTAPTMTTTIHPTVCTVARARRRST
jgi:hypothetical protein